MGLQRFARPFWRFRAMRVFRDEKNLSAHPDLFAKVTAALGISRCLYLWHFLKLPRRVVRKEHNYWINNKEPDI
jgi:hypothetical protein